MSDELDYSSPTVRTAIYFDLRGQYSKIGNEYEWVGTEEQVGTLVVRKSEEEITYRDVIDGIWKKLDEERGIETLKLSYLPKISGRAKPVYIRDDDDVYGYLSYASKANGCVLNVEVVENNWGEVFPTARINEGFDSTGIDGCEVMENAGEMTVYGEGMMQNVEAEHEEENDDLNHDVDDSFIEIEVDTQAVDYSNREWEDDIDLRIGQEFASKKDVKEFVYRAAHVNCFDIDIINSDKKLLVLKCMGAKDGCKWKLRVAKVKNSDCFSVRTYTKLHTCSRNEITDASTKTKHRRFKPRLVASFLHEVYPGKFDTPNPNQIMGMVKRTLGIDVSYSTARRGKWLAVADIRGSPKESFEMLHSYLFMLEKKNPGTKTFVEVDEENKFKYLFVALGASIEGFNFMRKVIIVDETFLKNGDGGVLIIATAQDPNHHHYPIAFVIVDGENHASWNWFLSTLKTVLLEDPELVFVSDRHGSIIKAFREVYPMSKHGFCIFHISLNVRSRAGSTDKELIGTHFRECARVYSEVEFERLYGAFKERYEKVGRYLEDKVDKERWARCYFPGERYNIDTTNCAESMNNVLNEAPKYSLLPMLDMIVGKISQWFNEHRNVISTIPISQKLVPHVNKELHTRMKEAKTLNVHELNRFLREYNVIGGNGRSYIVDLKNKTCTCKKFDIDQYPCEHAIAAAISIKDEPIPLANLCSNYYHMELWAKAYIQTIYPVPHRDEWVIPQNVQDCVVLPPDKTNKKGRIQETRYTSVGEHGARSGSNNRSRGMFGVFMDPA